jgi:hypothetical protein
MEFIKEIILESETNVGYIGDVNDILEIANDLLEDGVTIYFDEEKELEDIIEDNDILQITKIICEDCGKVKYFIEEVFDEEGYTIPDDELVITYVDSDLLDCIEYSVLDTEIVPVEIEYVDNEPECDGDCDNCTLHDEEFEDEDLAEVLTDELLESISEVDENDTELIYDLIADKINEAFEMGYQEALEDSLDELQDSIDAIKSLKITEE